LSAREKHALEAMPCSLQTFGILPQNQVNHLYKLGSTALAINTFYAFTCNFCPSGLFLLFLGFGWFMMLIGTLSNCGTVVWEAVKPNSEARDISLAMFINVLILLELLLLGRLLVHRLRLLLQVHRAMLSQMNY
jgi:hypothetical protein